MASSKSSKKSSGGSPRSYSEIYKSSAGAPVVQQSAPAQNAPAKSTAVKSAPVPATSDSVDWWSEYGYVLSDLRYLGLVTAGLLVAIIVVGFFM
jgi:hypothetical protein